MISKQNCVSVFAEWVEVNLNGYGWMHFCVLFNSFIMYSQMKLVHICNLQFTCFCYCRAALLLKINSVVLNCLYFEINIFRQHAAARYCKLTEPGLFSQSVFLNRWCCGKY